MTPRSARVTAGGGLVLMAALAVVATLGIEGHPGSTAFRVALAAWLAVAALDVVVAGALHEVFRPAQAAVSALAAAFRLVYAGVLVVATGFLALAAQRPDDAAATRLARDAFEGTWGLGLGLFGLHLLLLGWLCLRADVPTWLAWAVVLAGAAYSLDATTRLLLPDRSAYAGLATLLVGGPAIVGELGLALWMLLVRRPARPLSSLG